MKSSDTASSLRVLFLTPYYKPYWGGIERAIEKLSNGLLCRPDISAVGVLTTSFAFPRRHMHGLAPMEVVNGGVQVFRVPGRPRTAPPFFSVPLVWFPPRAFRRVVNSFRPDILHWVGDGWFWGHQWSARAAEKTTGMVFTPSFHSLEWSRCWLRPINVALCRLADRVTALSRLEANRVRRTYLVKTHKQAIIPWGVDAPDADSGRTANGDQRLTVLCVGRLGRHKGQCFLLHVWAHARRRFNRPARLVLVGSDEEDAGGGAALGRLIPRLGLEDDVLVAGEVSEEELHRWYSRADVFALFSRYEAFGLVFFEAMIRGVPVLTHRVGANAEMLRRGAVLTSAYDCSSSIEAMVKLVNDEAYRNDLAAQAKAYAAHFTWERVVGRFVVLYREILEERRGRLR